MDAMSKPYDRDHGRGEYTPTLTQDLRASVLLEALRKIRDTAVGSSSNETRIRRIAQDAIALIKEAEPTP